MKIQHFILLSLLFGCCAVSAQTTNAFTNTNTPPSSGAIDLIQDGTDTTWTDQNNMMLTNDIVLHVAKRDDMELRGVTLTQKHYHVYSAVDAHATQTRIISADSATLYRCAGPAQFPSHLSAAEIDKLHRSVFVVLHGGIENNLKTGNDYMFLLEMTVNPTLPNTAP